MFGKKKKNDDDEDDSSKNLPISPSRSAMKEMMHKKGSGKKKPLFGKKK